MKLYPEYSSNIVLYVLFRGAGQWYVVEKEECFLDRVAFAKAFGIEPTQDDISLVRSLDNGNIEVILSLWESFAVSVESLKELIQIYPPRTENDSVLEMAPSVYINFDNKVLINSFCEPSGVFEKYAPEGWSARYGSFLELIPENDIYWLREGSSLIG